MEEHVLREAIGSAANQGKWFKSIDKGEALGRLIALAIDRIPDSDLCRTMQKIEQWAYGS